MTDLTERMDRLAEPLTIVLRVLYESHPNHRLQHSEVEDITATVRLMAEVVKALGGACCNCGWETGMEECEDCAVLRAMPALSALTEEADNA